MTKYASSDITNVTNAQCRTGGHARVITNPKEVAKGGIPEYEGERLIVDCAECEPILRGKDSWSSDPTNIPLTPSEKAEADKLEKDGLKTQALMTGALAEMARDFVANKK